MSEHRTGIGIGFGIARGREVGWGIHYSALAPPAPRLFRGATTAASAALNVGVDSGTSALMTVGRRR